MAILERNISVKIKLFLLVFIVNIIFNTACKRELSKAEIIVNECIVAHGGNNFEQINLDFDFRDKHYNLKKNGLNFKYERISTDSANVITNDIFTNTSFERFVNNIKVNLADTMVSKYKNSINSVMYFILLPQPLNDAAVNKKYLGETNIGGQKYHKIEVSFSPENGGKDHEDIFVYWINSQTKTMDYFAYRYKTDGGGIRFREAINIQNIGGIRFQNYINYAPTDSSQTLQNLDKSFSEGKLREFSRIENNNLKFSIFDK